MGIPLPQFSDTEMVLREWRFLYLKKRKFTVEMVDFSGSTKREPHGVDSMDQVTESTTGP